MYDGVAASSFGMFLCSLDRSDGELVMARQSLVTDSAPLRAEPIVFGVHEETPELSLTFSSGSPISAMTAAAVAGWLMSPRGMTELVIAQPDMYNLRFRCRVTELRRTVIDGGTVAFTARIRCGAPWAFGARESAIGTAGTVTIINSGFESVSPMLRIVASGGEFVLTYGKETHLYRLNAGEIITMDCGERIITSSQVLNRYNDFYGTWPQLLPGKSIINFTGASSVIAEWEPRIRFA